MTIGKMKENKENKSCPLCAKKVKLSTDKEGGICPDCVKVVKLLKNKPEALVGFAAMADIPADYLLRSQQVEQELPDVLDGVRYRTTDRERNTWYVSVSEMKGNPVEIFASTAFDRDQHLQSRISNLTTITRLISLILRHVFLNERLTLEKTLTQLKRSSRQPNDLPDMLGKVLAKYIQKTSKTIDQESPENEIVIP